MANRNHVIDIAKGLGIFLVVFGHVIHIAWVREYIWNFHMPLFFFISGFLFKEGEAFSSHLKKRVKSILIPYVIFFIVTYGYWFFLERHVRGGEYSPMHQLLGLPFGTYEGKHLNFNGALWFLPCLFSTDMLFYLITRTCVFHKLKTIISLLFFFAIGTFCLRNEIVYLPFGLHTAFFALTFYGIGYLSKNNIESFCEIKNSSYIMLLLAISILIIQVQCLGVYSGKINSADLTYVILGLIGIMFVFAISVIIKKSIIIEYLGFNSLVILGFQEQIYRIVIKCFSIISGFPVEFLRSNMLVAFCISVITILFIVPIVYLWNRWCKVYINKVLN